MNSKVLHKYNVSNDFARSGQGTSKKMDKPTPLMTQIKNILWESFLFLWYASPVLVAVAVLVLVAVRIPPSARSSEIPMREFAAS